MGAEHQVGAPVPSLPPETFTPKEACFSLCGGPLPHRGTMVIPRRPLLRRSGWRSRVAARKGRREEVRRSRVARCTGEASLRPVTRPRAQRVIAGLIWCGKAAARCATLERPGSGPFRAFAAQCTKVRLCRGLYSWNGLAPASPDTQTDAVWTVLAPIHAAIPYPEMRPATSSLPDRWREGNAAEPIGVGGPAWASGLVERELHKFSAPTRTGEADPFVDRPIAHDDELVGTERSCPWEWCRSVGLRKVRA